MRAFAGLLTCLMGMGISRPLVLLLPRFSDRKKVLDFYQRACLSGYCSAFAYKPMTCTLSSQLNGKCIELVQVPGQNSIFTVCELPSAVPVKPNPRRSSWSSDGTVSPYLSASGMGHPGASQGHGITQQPVPQADHRNCDAIVTFSSSCHGEILQFLLI